MFFVYGLLVLFSGLNSHAAQEVLVRFDGKADLAQASSIVVREARLNEVFGRMRSVAESSQRPMLEVLDNLGLHYKQFYINNSILIYDFEEKHREHIEQIDGVKSIRPNVYFRMDEVEADIPSPAPSGPEGFLRTTRVTEVWDQLGVKGAGIVLAGHDTGYYWEHDALKTKYRGYQAGGSPSHDYNWHDAIHSGSRGCANSSPAPCDDKDHGTHTMGTMVGDDGGSNKIGVAPEAKWVGCRNMNKGLGSVATYLECFEFFMSPYPIGGSAMRDGRPEMAPHIVNNSWSCPTSEGCTGDEFYDVALAYKAAGILLVVAASNNGPGCGTISSPPANYTGDLISVAAYNRYRSEAAFFSSRGPSTWENRPAPSLIAPGASIRSSITSGRNSYTGKSGTSMASPIVAGVAALLWSHRPELIGNVEATTDILQGSADPITGGPSCGFMDSRDIPNASYGHGMLDAYSALTKEL